MLLFCREQLYFRTAWILSLFPQVHLKYLVWDWVGMEPGFGGVYLFTTTVLLERSSFFFFFLVWSFTRNTSLKTSSSILMCFTWQLTFSLICPLPACSGHCQAVCFFSEYHLLGQLACKDTLYPALSSAFAASKRELWFEEILSWVGESKLVLFELWGWHTPSSMQVQLCPIVSAWRRLFLCPQQARIILGKQTALPEGTSNSSSRQNNNSWLLHQ